MSRLDTVQWGADRLRVGPWRGDRSVAYLAPAPSQPPTTDGLERCLRLLPQQGYRSALTSALNPAEQQPFLAKGFTVHEHLHLLRHHLDGDLSEPPAEHNARPVVRRGRRRDREAVLAVDHRSFDAFWRFDASGLDDARRATPSARFRVVEAAAGSAAGRDRQVVGYAVTGRAGPVSYLQRLAVDPAHQRRGLASALVRDGLRWARRRGALSMLVNTQEHNAGALALYEALGFVLEPQGLDVLERPLGPPPDGADPGQPGDPT
jgi:ribosomal protein S18 acetylase RimI-like enzyme